MALSQQDIDVRLQQLGCCIGAEAKKLANYYMYGSECKEEQLQKLTLLNAYADMLSCYSVQATANTDNIFLVSFTDVYKTNFLAGNIVHFYLGDGEVYTYTVTGGVACTEINDIANGITNLPDLGDIIEVSAACNGSKAEVFIETTCGAKDLQVIMTQVIDEVTYETIIPVQLYQEGKCETTDDDNCITEDQVNTIVENIAKTCKKCFKSEGFAYYDN